MKHKVIVALILVPIVMMMMMLVRNLLRYNLGPLQAAWMPLCDATVWAPGFDEKIFESIPNGVDSNFVRAALGSPLTERSYDRGMRYWREGNDPTVKSQRIGSPDISCWWHYTTGPDGRSWSASSFSTHIRAFMFDTNGVLIKKVSEFYFD